MNSFRNKFKNTFKIINEFNSDMRFITIPIGYAYGLFIGLDYKTKNAKDIPIAIYSCIPEIAIGGILGYYWLYTIFPLSIYSNYYLYKHSKK